MDADSPSDLLASMRRTSDALAELHPRLDRVEASLLRIGNLLSALTDALVEVDDPDPGDDPTRTLDGPVENAARDQNQPL